MLVAAAVVVAVAAVGYLRYRRRDLGTPADRATFDTLHTASLAAPGLRAGLSEAGAQRAVRHLRVLLGTTAVALTDRTRVLAVDAASHHHHAEHAVEHARHTLDGGRTHVLPGREVSCGAPDCPVRSAVVWSLGLVGGGLLLAALALWFHYGTTVFFETIAAGFASCF